MNEAHISTQLHELPPHLPQVEDRFEKVRGRVHRHRRQQLVVTLVAVGAIAVAVLSGVLLLQGGSTGTAGQIATDPANTMTASNAPPANGSIPGKDKEIELSDPLTAVHTGTATVDLGVRPAGAIAVSLSFSCLTPGSFGWPDGASSSCDVGDIVSPTDPPVSPGYVIQLRPGQRTITITATPGASWQTITTYVRTVHTAWGVNAKGETYGVENDRGTPDLISAYASNGNIGYVYSDAIDNPGGQPAPTSPAQALAQQKANQGKTFTVPVYDSDGQTIVGHMELQ